LVHILLTIFKTQIFSKKIKKFLQNSFFLKKQGKIEKIINFVRNPLNINENDA